MRQRGGNRTIRLGRPLSPPPEQWVRHKKVKIGENFPQIVKKSETKGRQLRLVFGNNIQPYPTLSPLSSLRCNDLPRAKEEEEEEEGTHKGGDTIHWHRFKGGLEFFMGAVTEYGHKATRHPGFGPATLLAKCLGSIDPAEKTGNAFFQKATFGKEKYIFAAQIKEEMVV